MMNDYSGQQMGSYRLVRRLGSGGFASVYLGQHVLITTKQELYGLLLAHSLLRILMLRASQPQGLAPPTISFTDTIRLVDDSLAPLSLASVYSMKPIKDSLKMCSGNATEHQETLKQHGGNRCSSPNIRPVTYL